MRPANALIQCGMLSINPLQVFTRVQTVARAKTEL